MKKHLEYYLSFFLILFAGLFIIVQAAGQKNLQFEFVILFACAYVIWGVVHHVVHHSLTAKILLEYILVAALGVAAVFFVTSGGL